MCALALSSIMTPDLSSLVARGAAIKAQTKALNNELATINAELIAAGAGEYRAEAGGKATVVQPSAKFAPDAADIEAVRELLEDDESGVEIFKKLFTRSVVWTAVKGVRHVGAALLTAAKLRKLCALCEKPAAAFVIWS